MSEPEQSGEDLEPGLEHESIEDIRAERIMLDRAIGGWRGLFDSGTPTLVFVIVYLLRSDNL